MTFVELLRLGEAVVRVVLDSEQTAEIHVAEELTGRGAFRRIREEQFADAEGAALLQGRPELCSEQVDFDALRAFAPETLGRHYVEHLDRNGLSADSQATPTRYVDDPELAYLVRRFRQTHDVWHALVGLRTQGHEEVLIHAFSWGQLRLPVSALVVAFGTPKHLVLEGRFGALRDGLWDAYRAGRDACPLLPIWWERRWEAPIATVRRELGLPALAQG